MADAARSTGRRGRRLFAIAAGLACVVGALRVDRAPAVATSPPMQTAAARDGADVDGVPAPSTGMPPRAAPRASDADAPCDLTSPEPVTTEAQDAQDTETQARYDLMLARRLRATGSLIDQAVGSLLGRPEDWAPGELAEQVGDVARAAVLTSDAELYALALKACARFRQGDETGPAPDACSQLANSRLESLRPGNVMVWLHAAQAAREQGDTAAELEADFHASLARQGERLEDVALRVASGAMAPTDAAWLRYGTSSALAEQIVPAGGWGPLDEGFRLAGSCAPDQLGDVNRRELCERLARNLLDESAGTAALWTGVAIGVELGWSTDRLSAARSKARTMFAAASSLARFPPHDCRADVQLAILDATLASDAPVRLDVPRLQSAVDTMTRKRSDEAAKADAEREATQAGEKGDGS